MVAVSTKRIRTKFATHQIPKSLIYEKAALQNYTFKNKYFEIPLLVVVEADIQADTTDFGISEMDCYGIKPKNCWISAFGK